MRSECSMVTAVALGAVMAAVFGLGCAGPGLVRRNDTRGVSTSGAGHTRPGALPDEPPPMRRRP